jgi:hypothetical protein
MSSIREELHRHHGEASAEHKLKVLRTEMLRPIATVEAAAALLKQIDTDVIIKGLPDNVSPQEFDHVINWLNDAARDLREILDALTGEYSETHGHLPG